MSQSLAGKVAWITGAGSGIGEAAALALSGAGAAAVLTGRRAEPLHAVADRIAGAGAAAHVQPADMTDAAAVRGVAEWIERSLGRLDILVNNAGLNILERAWGDLTPAGAERVFAANLNGAFNAAIAALPIMRAQRDGVMIHTASMAGRYPGLMSGPAYSAAKHGVVAMSQTLNMSECVHGIRSCALCPGEVATPILNQRPNPVPAEERARMLQPEDCGNLILYIAGLPPHVCINEVLVTPTWNRGYVAAQSRKL